MSGINVIIDLNNFFYRCKNVLYTEIGDLNTDYHEGILMRKASTDFFYLLKQMPTYSRVILCMDHVSWRKDIIIKEGDYKGSRVKDDKFNWDKFYELMNTFGQIVENNGAIVSRLYGAEADDLVTLWSNYLNTNGDNCIIVTADKDMQQLVKYDGISWTLIYDSNSKTRKLMGPLEFTNTVLNEEEHVVDLFNMSDTFMTDETNNVLKSLINDSEFVELDPFIISFVKILNGDSGDDVPSVYSYVKDTKKGEMTYSITPAKALIILEKLKETHPTFNNIMDLFNDDVKNTLSDLIVLQYSKITGEYAPDKSIIEDNIYRNIQLVYLNPLVFPKEINDLFTKHTSTVRGKGFLKKSLNRISLLEGTVFYKNVQESKGNSFSGLTGLDLPNELL